MKKFAILLLAVAMFAVAGCSEDETTAPSTPPTIPAITLQTPITNSTDNNAMLTNSMVSMFNGLLSMSQAFAHATPTSANGTYTWTFTGDGITWTMTAVRQSDGSYVWTLKVTGLYGDANLTNFVLWSGTTSADGKTGSMTFYEPGVTGATDDVTWSVASNGAVTVTYRTLASGVPTYRVTATVNSDGSGTLDVYENGTTLTFHAAWNAAGAGTWTSTPIGGTPSSGSWS